jgi:serine/threonine protein kinase
LHPRKVLSDLLFNLSTSKLLTTYFAFFKVNVPMAQPIECNQTVNRHQVLYANVLKKRGFNRSLDMWSTGVIIYVALSGQFPFNESVDIEDQIKNAQFMYPSRPWSTISAKAVACIQKLLVVEHDCRYSVDQALDDSWIADQQCALDIARLEEEAGRSIPHLSLPPPVSDGC